MPDTTLPGRSLGGPHRRRKRLLAAVVAPLVLPLFTALAAVLPAPAAHAWSADAHEIICEIAWQRFTPAAKKLVRSLRRADPEPGRTFAASCAWADRVRERGGRFADSAPWHYVNVPAGADGIDPRRDCPAPKRCVTWAITRFGRQLADPGRSAASRAEALKFLAHFIGDVHQPLHVGRPDDRGGNEIAVDFLGDHGRCRRGAERDLHEVWDRHILARAGERGPAAARRLAAAVPAGSAAAWQNTDVLAWANESFALCGAVVYALPGSVARCGGRQFARIDEAYYARAVDVSRTRLQQAGVRLAHVIDLAARGTLPW